MKAQEIAALGRMKEARIFDAMLILALIGFFTVIPHVSRMLYFGDWDFWVDWKDKLWWPIIGPASALLVTSVGHYLAWHYLRLPLGATATNLSRDTVKIQGVRASPPFPLARQGEFSHLLHQPFKQIRERGAKQPLRGRGPV
jgi:hypothetical protein